MIGPMCELFVWHGEDWFTNRVYDVNVTRMLGFGK